MEVISCGNTSSINLDLTAILALTKIVFQKSVSLPPKKSVPFSYPLPSLAASVAYILVSFDFV